MTENENRFRSMGPSLIFLSAFDAVGINLPELCLILYLHVSPKKKKNYVTLEMYNNWCCNR